MSAGGIDISGYRLSHKTREGRLELISGRLTAKGEVDAMPMLYVIVPAK